MERFFRTLKNSHDVTPAVCYLFQHSDGVWINNRIQELYYSSFPQAVSHAQELGYTNIYVHPHPAREPQSLATGIVDLVA